MAYNIHKRLRDSFSDSELSQKKIRLPWCSSRKVCERRKPKRVAANWGIRSVYPERESIWEYLYENNNRKLKCSKRNKSVKNKSCTTYGCKRTFAIAVLLAICLGLAVSLWMPNEMLRADLITKVILSTKLVTLRELYSTVVREECCDKVKYLSNELFKTENLIRALHRRRKNFMLTSKTTGEVKNDINMQYIEGAVVTKGSRTQEWGGRIALWGVVPLWRAAPPPDTILALRRPMPSDCWPFSGSEGEMEIHLPKADWVDCLSIEHVRPDTARSAPRQFMVQGSLQNDTWTLLLKDEYKNSGPAKQYYCMKTNLQVKQINFQILNNQGNIKYTCIYRIHLYKYERF